MGVSLLSIMNWVLKFSRKFFKSKESENWEDPTEIIVVESKFEKSKDLWVVDQEYRDLGIKNIPWVVDLEN